MGKDKKQKKVVIRISEGEKLKNKAIRNLRIVKQQEEYSGIFTVIRKIPDVKKVEKIIALDPNHKNLSYGVDTQGKAIEIASANWLKVYDKRLDEIKSIRDRCKKRSKLLEVLDEEGNPIGKQRWKASIRWQKIDQAYKRALRKRREQTKTFLYTAANKLYKEYDLVAIGDYTPSGKGISKKMSRAMNNRSLIGRFKGVLSWVAVRNGKQYEEFKEKGTTRTCHVCVKVVTEGISPDKRMWTCKKCKTDHIRDENAAINGLKQILRNQTKKKENISYVSGSDLAFKVKERWVWCVKPSGVQSTLQGPNCGDTASAKKLNRKLDFPIQTIRFA